jgi:hypothetical protein
MLISISSPYRKSGLMYEKYKAHYGKDNDSILVVQCPTRTLNPTIPQSVVDQAMAEDPDAARSEFLAQFRDDISDFISRDAILACVPEIRERPPEFAHKYIGAVDPSGGRNDSMTLAIAHYEGSTAILDLIREVKPPFSPEGVVDEFCQTLARYRCASVLGDKFGAEWVQSQFRNRGVNYRETDKSKSDIYVGILPAINSKAVSLLNNETLINQLCALERRATRGARRQDTIDHGPGQHDDVANAATIALLYASRTSRYTRNKKPGKILLGYMQSKGHLKKRQQQW